MGLISQPSVFGGPSPSPRAATARRRCPAAGRYGAWLVVGVMAVVALALPPAAAAKDTTNPLAERSRFFGDVDVSIANLDVVVTDRKGVPVDGLTKGDFELLVDGEPVEILNFFAAAGTAGDDDASVEADAGPAAALQLPTAQRLWLVVYVDSSSIRGADRNRVIGQLKGLLQSNLGHGDRVMVVAQGPEQEIRHRFSDPPEESIAALDEIADEIAGIGQFESARLSILNQMARGSAPRVAQAPRAGISALQQDTRIHEAETSLNDIYSWVQWRRSGLRSAATRMEALLDALAGVEGRKAMLFVGEGTPYRIGESLFQAWIDRYQPMFASMRQPPTRLLTLNAHREAARYSVQREYLRLADRAAASRVAFYAIDAAQENASVGISAELPGVTGTLANETGRRMAQQESLQRLVTTTGGRYIADLDRTAEVVKGLRDDFSRYYSLGFTPPGEADDEPRTLRVRLADPELKARHRSSFRATSLDERMAEQLYAALYLGVSPNPLAVRLEIVGVEPAEAKKQYKLTVLARIPLASLLLIPQADELLGRASVWLAVANDAGSMSDVHGRRLPIRVQQKDLATAEGQDVGYTIEVLVADGRQQVAVVVRDDLAVISSTVTLELDDGQPLSTVSEFASRD